MKLSYSNMRVIIISINRIIKMNALKHGYDYILILIHTILIYTILIYTIYNIYYIDIYYIDIYYIDIYYI